MLSYDAAMPAADALIPAFITVFDTGAAIISTADDTAASLFASFIFDYCPFFLWIYIFQAYSLINVYQRELSSTSIE